MRLSSSAMGVVDVNHKLVGRWPQGEYSMGIFPAACVEPVAVNKPQLGPTQRK